jgi:hypothetical protein
MSADNWQRCPRCLKLADEEYGKLVAKVGKAYGKVSAEKYAELVESIKTRPEVPETFREDYEFYMSNDGHFRLVPRKL